MHSRSLHRGGVSTRGPRKDGVEQTSLHPVTRRNWLAGADPRGAFHKAAERASEGTERCSHEQSSLLFSLESETVIHAELGTNGLHPSEVHNEQILCSTAFSGPQKLRQTCTEFHRSLKGFGGSNPLLSANESLSMGILHSNRQIARVSGVFLNICGSEEN